MGRELIEKMISAELVGKAIQSTSGAAGSGFPKPTIYFLLRFAPWSLLACIGFWRVVRHPAADALQRRMERFLFCWFIAGLLLFSLGSHQRPDLLFPLIPVAALFAGREAGRLAGAAQPRVVMAGIVAVLALSLTWIGNEFGPALARTKRAIQTKALESVAGVIRSRVGEDFPLTYVDSESTFQFYMNTMRTRVPAARAAELLRGDTAAFVAVGDVDQFRNGLGTNAPPLHVLLRWPATGKSFIAIVSNHPRLERTARMAVATGSPASSRR
jgi:hypothetical protein